MEEIKAVISHIKNSHIDFIPEQIDISKIRITGSYSLSANEGGVTGHEPVSDDDYMSAKDYVISTGKASTSSLQTAFRWGYNKAARIMNDLEQFNIIGGARSGERYREILVGKENLEEEVAEDTNRDVTTDDIFV
jgi:S-DNA-T family DNA segregation ATPase FtsK/SpoIIIE